MVLKLQEDTLFIIHTYYFQLSHLKLKVNKFGEMLFARKPSRVSDAAFFMLCCISMD